MKRSFEISTTTLNSINQGADESTTSGRLFFLDLGAGRVLSANPDGSDLKTVLNEGRRLPETVRWWTPAARTHLLDQYG